jgi:hypothetical protein
MQFSLTLKETAELLPLFSSCLHIYYSVIVNVLVIGAAR